MSIIAASSIARGRGFWLRPVPIRVRCACRDMLISASRCPEHQRRHWSHARPPASASRSSPRPRLAARLARPRLYSARGLSLIAARAVMGWGNGPRGPTRGPPRGPRPRDRSGYDAGRDDPRDRDRPPPPPRDRGGYDGPPRDRGFGGPRGRRRRGTETSTGGRPTAAATTATIAAARRRRCAGATAPTGARRRATAGAARPAAATGA